MPWSSFKCPNCKCETGEIDHKMGVKPVCRCCDIEMDKIIEPPTNPNGVRWKWRDGE
jgi:hypothetical protein